MATLERDTPLFRSAAIPSAAQYAAMQLRETIVSGRLQPGDRLVESELAGQMHLSRGPIRSALHQLSQEGLVVLRRNRGAVVASITVEDVLEVYALRAALGSLALRELIAGRRATPEVIHRLEHLAARAKSKVARKNQAVLIDRELAFQEGVIEASSLPRVITQYREISVEIRRFINTLNLRYRDTDEILREVDQVLDAIRRGDLRMAEHVWHGRFRRAVTEFVELIPEGMHLLQERPWLLSALDEYMGESDDHQRDQSSRHTHDRPGSHQAAQRR